MRKRIMPKRLIDKAQGLDEQALQQKAEQSSPNDLAYMLEDPFWICGELENGNVHQRNVAKKVLYRFVNLFDVYRDIMHSKYWYDSRITDSAYNEYLDSRRNFWAVKKCIENYINDVPAPLLDFGWSLEKITNEMVSGLFHHTEFTEQVAMFGKDARTGLKALHDNGIIEPTVFYDGIVDYTNPIGREPFRPF